MILYQVLLKIRPVMVNIHEMTVNQKYLTDADKIRIIDHDFEDFRRHIDRIGSFFENQGSHSSN